MSSSVLVVGSVNMDVVARVSRHPAPGETIEGSDVAFFPGGKGGNQAIAAQRAGASTSLLACLGEDAFGDELHAFLKESGLDTSLIRRTNEAATGTALIFVDKQAQNSIAVIPGANARLTPAAAESVSFSEAKICVAQFETPLETVLAAFQKAKEAGAQTLLNPSPSKRVPSEILAQTDFLVLNETELAQQSDLSSLPSSDAEAALKAAEALRAGRNLTVIATLGANGLVFADATGVGRIEGIKVKAVDTTGAGDCFTGALAAKLAENTPLREALRFANAAAALSVQKDGAAPSMPFAEDVLTALKTVQAA